ncbi:hypothetical protein GY14_30240 [Delftia tsuruhatensis]|nr:hypothetical protein GY14_30240 [Delftia tsuruhatensis]
MARKSNMSAESAAIVVYLRKFGPQTRQKLTEVVPTDTPGGLAKRLSNLRANGWVQTEEAEGMPVLYAIKPCVRGLFPELDARPSKVARSPAKVGPSATPAKPALEQAPQPAPVERFTPGPMVLSAIPRMGTARPGALAFLACPSRGVRC